MNECDDIYNAIDSLYASVQEFHHHETFPDDPDPQHPHLVPTLKPYQRRAVQWMVSKESKKDIIDDLPSASSTSTTVVLPTGGILADEMGLGKTVEVLACILLNPRKFTEEEQKLSSERKNSYIIPDDDDSLVKTVENSSPIKSFSKRRRLKTRILDEEMDCSTSVPSENQSNEDYEIIIRGANNESLSNSPGAAFQDIKIEPNSDSCPEENLQCQLQSNEVSIDGGKIKHEPAESSTKHENSDEIILQACKMEIDPLNINISSDQNELNRELQPEEFTLAADDVKCDPAEKYKDFTGSLKAGANLGQEEELNLKQESEEVLMEVDGTAHSSLEDNKNCGKTNKFSKVFNSAKSDPLDISSTPDEREKIESKQATPKVKTSGIAPNEGVKTKSTSRKRKSTIDIETPPVKSETTGTSQKKRTKSGKPKIDNRKVLNEWYEAMLAEVTPKNRSIKEPESDLHCFCDSDSFKDRIQCNDCKFYQHKHCVNYNGKKIKKQNYLCPTCILKKERIRAKTTFIVSPSSISDQWIEEIEKHTNPRLKVLKYEGVWVSGYLQPSTIAEYDVLLTTYETLCRELNYVPDEETGGTPRSLRHAKRYFAPQSPLPCVEWWRICLDEAQMVELATKPSVMMRKLAAIHRWAVTGTPIQKTINDIAGLVEFLGLDSIAHPGNWRALQEKKDDFVFFLSRIMWRHSKHEVIHEFGVPPQTVKCVWLKFSAIESHFYKRQHFDCSAQFLAKVEKYRTLDIPLKTIDRKEVSRILMPLLSLRQACSHPQAVRGKLLSRRATMTMTELLDIMVKKTQNESEEFLRQYISALNGLAGLHIIIDQIGDAIECYREVLLLCQHYEGSLVADTLQKIHTMHNLAEVIEFKPDEVAPTLRDASAKEDAAKLEKEYLDKKRAVMTNTQQQAATMAAEVSKLCDGATLGFSEWWVKVVDWAPSSKELVTQLKSSLCGTSDSFISLAPKINSKDRLKYTLAVWLADMDSLRISILQKLQLLEITPTEDLVHKALCCHLRQSKKSKKSCLLCETEEELKTYESLLFMVSSKVSKTQPAAESDEENEEEEAKEEGEPSTSKMSSSLQALKQVTVFESSWKGSWKNSQYLILLLELSNFARLKGAPENLYSESKQHLKLMNVLKREFKTLRLLWTQNSELVQSCDELVMAKMRFRLRLPSDTPKKKVTNKADIIHIIEPHQINFEIHRLRSESKVAAENLKRKTGTLLYLKNLLKEKTEDKVNICPICRSEMKDKWAVLVCGHCVCYECTPSMLSLSASTEHVECAICRDKTLVAEISFVDCQETPDDGAIKGSYSTKIEGVLRLVQTLKSEDSSVKILVFSSWEKVLDIIEEGFQENNISCQRLKSGPKHKKSVSNFKSKEDVTVLLLQFKSGAKGLNLTEATHIILVEPVLNPSDELQAVGRVHRMGQTKPTFVHRFVVKNTIEEKMLSAIKDSDINQWRKNEVTLKQLSELFSYDLTNSRLEPSNI